MPCHQTTEVWHQQTKKQRKEWQERVEKPHMTKEVFRQQIRKQENVWPEPEVKLQAEVVVAAVTKVKAVEKAVALLVCQRKREKEKPAKAASSKNFG